MDNNHIGAEGVQYLAQTLKTNTTVTHINLSGNKINDGLLEDINKILKNRELQTIEALFKKIEQGIDSTQEKLLAVDIESEGEQKVSKVVQQSSKAYAMSKKEVNYCKNN
ncbi:MAG: hypothetical protein LBE72_00170 [Rickettsia sp.]|nr:hypothetical protein [Rickettsia sp.]